MEGILIVPLILFAGIVFAVLAIVAPEQAKPQQKAPPQADEDQRWGNLALPGDKWYFTRPPDDM